MSEYDGIPKLREVPQEEAAQAAYMLATNSPDWLTLRHYFLAQVQKAQNNLGNLNPHDDTFKRDFSDIQHQIVSRAGLLGLINQLALEHKSRQELENG